MNTNDRRKEKKRANDGGLDESKFLSQNSLKSGRSRRSKSEPRMNESLNAGSMEEN